MGQIWGWIIATTLLAVIIGSTTASARPIVSGEWETAAAAECAKECVDERHKLTFEVESTLSLDVDYDALTLSLNSLWGLRGLLEATLGAEIGFDVTTIGGSITLAPPIDDDHRIPPGRPLLVRSRLDTELFSKGVELSLGVIHDDVNFADREAAMTRYDARDQRFRAGTVVDLEGETARGAELNAETGFCFDPDGRVDLPGGSLSGEVCETGLLDWTRTTLEIADLSMHSLVLGAAELTCEPTGDAPSLSCELEIEVDAVPPGSGFQNMSVEWDYDPVYPDRRLDEITLDLSHEANVDAELTLNRTLQWEELDVEAERAVHRGEAVLHWAIDGTYERTEGVTDIALEGGIERGQLELSTQAEWDQSDDRLGFDALSMAGDVQVGSLTLEGQFDADLDGFDEFELKGTVEF